MSLPSDAPRPRLCRVLKEIPEQDYGFNLHADKNKGQFIGAVDPGSPAERAGLRQGDRIVAVNGMPVANEPHRQVVLKIKENPMECSLTVIDEEGADWYKERKIPVPVDTDFIATRKASAEIPPPPKHDEYRPSTPPPPAPFVSNARPPSYHEIITTSRTVLLRPRLCTLIKPNSDSEFGFNLHAERDMGHFIGKVDPQSIAERAGLEEGQRIVGVNGTLIYPHSAHKEVVNLIKGSPMRAELLVASPEVDKWYKNNNMEFNFDDAEQTTALEGKYAEVKHAPRDKGVTNGVHVEKEQKAPEELPKPKRSPPPEKKITNDVHIKAHQEIPVLKHERAQDTPTEFASDATKAHARATQQNGATKAGQQQQQQGQDWFGLTARELRERVGQHKKSDPRSQQLSLQQKYDIIRNL